MPETDEPPSLGRWVLPLHGTSPSALQPVREWVRRHLSDVGEAHLQDALTVVTELVTNAYEHGGGPSRLELRRNTDPCLISIEVTDATEAQPVAGRSSLPGPRGRGLQLVNLLSTGWGVRYDRGRPVKTVWAQVPCEGSDRIPCPAPDAQSLPAQPCPV
ncbi:ATP-binding protein [Amycolatopsis australiensis]|uniref:Anti-sigma regulatory factor (Ser/Thr protein kinase) n=1 Tax=Amycolatopsis australiensis TaxID=546364 RepID=A0A1K1SRF9_9PSEU|nr:ATP-binding protein [Amycolatopsis australiensis]SFW87008.1 Anti-sigma regulatory factor (Ser/Thr protein kinase) [Amycolatopsis australiensis]